MKLFRAILIGAVLLLSSIVAIHPTPASASVAFTSYNHEMSVTSAIRNIESPVIYVVRSGDTLTGIADTFSTDWRGLYCENQHVIGSDPNMITPGERLIIAAGKCSYANEGGKTTTTTSYVTGSPQSIAWNLLSNFGQDRHVQYDCLNNIIMTESSWNITAYNPSGAYGIPQALPGWKMAGNWGQNWQTSAYVQLFWMIKVYIPGSYGTPCGAWAFHIVHGWY